MDVSKVMVHAFTWVPIIQQALESGQRKALWLINSGIVQGAIISVKDSVLPLGIFPHKIRRLQKAWPDLRGGDSLQVERFRYQV